MTKYFITGTTGKLGKSVVEEMLAAGVAKDSIVGGFHTSTKEETFKQEFGIELRKIDYECPDDWPAALAGIDVLLFISSPDISKQREHHALVVEQAKLAGVKFIAYTSILKADVSDRPLGQNHVFTEGLIRESGIPFVFLRKGWFFENTAQWFWLMMQVGEVLSGAGDGKFSAPSYKELAKATVKVLLKPCDYMGKTLELAADEAYTEAEITAEFNKQLKAAGHDVEVPFKQLTPADLRQKMLDIGALPTETADMLQDAAKYAALGNMYSDDKTLSNILERPTTHWKELTKVAVAGFAKDGGK